MEAFGAMAKAKSPFSENIGTNPKLGKNKSKISWNVKAAKKFMKNLSKIIGQKNRGFNEGSATTRP